MGNGQYPGVLNCPFTDPSKQICVTLEEWESIGQQFEKATHYAEKALHKVLSQSIVPMVTAELRVCFILSQTQYALYLLQGSREKATDGGSCRASQTFLQDCHERV